MKYLWVLAITIVVGGLAYYLFGSPRFMMTADNPTVARLKDGSIGVTGHFHLTKYSRLSEAYPAAIPSTGTGGACLVTQMLDASGQPMGSCTDDSSCSRSAMEEQLLGDHTEYCHPTEKTCWIKYEAWCDKSGKHDGKPWDVGVINDTNPTPVKAEKGTHWRVYACVNGLKASGESNTACGDGVGSSRHEWGNVVTAN